MLKTYIFQFYLTMKGVEKMLVWRELRDCGNTLWSAWKVSKFGCKYQFGNIFLTQSYSTKTQKRERKHSMWKNGFRTYLYFLFIQNSRPFEDKFQAENEWFEVKKFITNIFCYVWFPKNIRENAKEKIYK